MYPSMHCRAHCPPPGQTPPPLRLANTPTPPLGRHSTPLLVRHPLDRPSWADTLPGQTSPWADNPLWSMSGWYAFYWNTFFFFFNLHAAFYIGYTIFRRTCATSISGRSRISRWGGGHQPLSSGQNLLFGMIFAKNCMKMKEIGPRVRRIPSTLFLCANVSNVGYPHPARGNGFHINLRRQIYMLTLSWKQTY